MLHSVTWYEALLYLKMNSLYCRLTSKTFRQCKFWCGQDWSAFTQPLWTSKMYLRVQLSSRVNLAFIQSFPSPRPVTVSRPNEPGLSLYLPMGAARIVGFIPFPRILTPFEMQTLHSNQRNEFIKIVDPYLIQSFTHLSATIIIIIIMLSLTLSRHPSLSSIASGRSSGLHPVSAQSCCMKVRAGRPAFVLPCEGVHRSTSLMRSSLLLQQCPACLVHLILIVFAMGSRWPCSCCLMGCCPQDLFNIARSILV